MNVMYAADNNYAEIMGVSILSLLECNKSADEINMFIIEDEINEENKVKLTSMIDEYRRNVIFIKKPNIRQLLGV